ncbi:hypothetical protein ACHAXR_000169, partial [Thalassiosira sp. AJA248-18]
MKFSTMIAVGGVQLFGRSSAFAPVITQSPRSPTSLKNSLRNLAILADQSPRPLINQKSNMSIAQKETKSSITEKEVRALFDLWNSALATGDSRIVADRYIKNPMLLPTVSDQPRTD